MSDSSCVFFILIFHPILSPTLCGVFFVFILPFFPIFIIMDLDVPISEYFNLDENERDEVIIELAKHYYDKFVNVKNESIFLFTTNELIHRFHLEKQLALKEENYERADIFLQLIRIFIQLQDEKKFD